MSRLDVTTKYSYIKYKLTELNENPSEMWFKLCTFKMNKLFVMCGQTMFHHVKCLFSKMFADISDIYTKILFIFRLSPMPNTFQIKFQSITLIRILWLNGIKINLNEIKNRK